jgi:hypothetical protein
VINRKGEKIASAVTNFDIHDIARAARTYGVKRFYVVTPLEDQRQLIDRILDHWTVGVGSELNPDRRTALKKVSVVTSIEGVYARIRQRTGRMPTTVVTCAKEYEGRVSYPKLRRMLSTGKPYVLLMGTAWGFPADFILAADYILEPVKGGRQYNHLSVRSAASIIMDRLLGGP